MESFWKLFRSDTVLLLCHMLIIFPWSLWQATLRTMSGVCVTEPNICGLCSFPTMANFLGHTQRNHCAPKYSACLKNFCGIRDTVISHLLVIFIRFSLRMKSSQESPAVIWLAGEGNILYFPAALASWIRRMWRGNKPSHLTRTVRKEGSRTAWSKWCRAHSETDTKCLLMLHTLKSLWFSLFGVWMFGMCFSSLLTEDVSLKREAVFHSTCSTYAALAILFFLPAQSMQ